jgi:hypothetical protein
MATPNARRIDARDRRLVAVHEAGHQLVADYLGVPMGGAYIRRAAAPEPGELSWCGHVSLYGSAPAEKLCLVAVAGAVAEAAWSGDEPDLAMMSESDWEMAGFASRRRVRRAGYGRDLFEALDDVWSLLRRGGPLWPELVREARRLIEEARGTLSHTV